jgi:hypothetical protein
MEAGREGKEMSVGNPEVADAYSRALRLPRARSCDRKKARTYTLHNEHQLKHYTVSYLGVVLELMFIVKRVCP